jgi:mono/diheme cytochrome c family protein
MNKRFRVRIAAAILVAALWSTCAWAQGTAATPDYSATLKQYCVTCHNDKLKTADLSLEKMDMTNIPAGAEVWEKVITKVRVGMMPPQGLPQPDAATRSGLVSYLEASLDKAAAQKPNPGRPLVHRLNRTEYANAIRDLLGIEVDSSSLLPPDDSGYGFDNIADVLGVSPVLLERYVNAAGKISALAVGDPNTPPGSETFRVRQDASQDVHIEGLPIGTVGGILVKTTLPLDGEYVISPKFFRTNLGVLRGLEYANDCETTVDGERVHLATFGGDADFKASLANMTTAADAVEARCTVRLKLKAGPRVITVNFLRRSATENTLRLQPFIRSSNDTLDPIGHPHYDSVAVTGPFNPTGPGDTPSRRQIFTCHPANQADEQPCARKILTTLMRRAYRGEGTDKDLTRLMAFYAKGRNADGGTFESGVQTALERLLASPKFVFRAERDPANAAPGTIYRISDLELASRLSFFLWSTIPDDELLQVASQGKLHEPATLDREVHRMLADPKSEAMVENFAGQWLYLRNLKNMIPNSLEFPDFDDNLRQAFLKETELFFGSIMHEDRNVLDLMTANYTFVNERLARQYGIPDIYGSNFRRVTLTDDARKGLLGKGAILMVTSHTDRTSPVVRGKWILDNLMGAPPPPMPANVPPLDESNLKNGKVLTMRERMEAHRANAYCATCHKMMDPIGFSMENFDATGAWRTKEGGTGGTAIDASGQLLDGTKISGPVQLRAALVKNPDIFVGTMTEKLMIYALGRGLNYNDMPVVRSIVRDASHNNYRFTSLVMGIIRSEPFQMRIKIADNSTTPPVRTASLK